MTKHFEDNFMSKSKSEFKFIKHVRIGTEGAEEDSEYLFDCFVDTGDLEVLKDTTHPARIVEGRTGAGKTALLLYLKEISPNSTMIDPEELSLQFISNSNVIKFLTAKGVDLDLFYKLLWKHILTVELIKLKYNIRNELEQDSFFTRIYTKYFGDKKKKEAYDYLREWGEKFWKNTEDRVKQVTTKFENDLTSKISAKIPNFGSELAGGQRFTEEEIGEIVYRAQEVVNSVQMQQLSRVVRALAEEDFADTQQSYYIIIDKLDENWVDEDLRYKLIRALVETIKDLRKIQTAKVIISIRRDLIDRVFRYTRDPGFQEEKYQTLFLNIYWEKRDLMLLVEKRINRLIERQYTGDKIKWNDIITPKVGEVLTVNYLIDRTMHRPRDIISFINGCIDKSTGFKKVTAARIRDAESLYSDVRFRALGDEWIADYPNLMNALRIFKKRDPVFNFNDIKPKELEDLVVEILSSNVKESCLIEDICHKYYEDNISYQDTLAKLLRIFYRVGVIGVRVPSRGISWSFKKDNIIHESQITGEERIEILPMFYRVFGIG